MSASHSLHAHPDRRLIACAALAVVSLMIATVAIAQAPAAPPANQAPQPPAPQIPPALVPSHVVDLMTEDGITAFNARWKTMEAKIVEGPALPNALAGYKTSYDISPHAGEEGFDDSSWPTIDAKGLSDRRGGGKVSFVWFRTSLTIPARIGNFDTAGDKFQVAIFGINGPISVAPANFLFFRQASIEFYK